jgi:magnesium transporter
MPWYQLQDPNDPDLDRLAEQYHLHPLHIEDCRSDNERTKSDRAPDYLFTVLKAIHIPPGSDPNFPQLSMFLGTDFCITVGGAECDSTGVFDRARRSGEDDHPSKLFYLIFDSVVDSYFSAVATFDDQIDELQDRVLDAPSPDVLKEIFHHKSCLVQLRRTLVNTRDACAVIQREAEGLIEPELAPFFRDVYDHISRSIDLVETERDLLTGTLDVYLSTVANRTNEVVKVLTVLSTIALPALVISSIYGMNLKGLPLLDSPHGGVLIFAAMACTTLLLLWILRRFRWL